MLCCCWLHAQLPAVLLYMCSCGQCAAWLLTIVGKWTTLAMLLLLLLKLLLLLLQLLWQPLFLLLPPLL
jgi:hypothetical protein